ncbi:F5/8 type C domain-containing protein [Micromonospora pallida]|uniref:F5/8 type C domain-containing protein n=1 Tax=Micromonospora pallida TaxID=145854 RepID=A0A1C6SZT0_9ACTN|nr:F5/8 type C domain-containing protein [Micromonospora pallida]
MGKIAVVPLDDRPFTSYTPVAVAEAGGHQALTPPKDLLGEYFTYGQADAVGSWWRTAAAAADGSVVAAPMLAYGGLVASRTCETSLADARRRLDVLDEVKRKNPDKPLYAFDVIMRLTIEPTSSYPGMYSGPIRRWAILMDQVENLGQEELRAEYEQVASEIPEEIKADFHCARARDHQINRDMIERVAKGTIDYLILGQDDATEHGPHRLEKAALAALVAERGVADRVKIYPGADTLGALLVAKHITERLGAAPTVDVEWSRTPGDQWVAPYQDVPYATLVDEYLRTLGARPSDSPDADILLMANTAGGGNLEPFADRIHDAVARGRLVAIGDDALAGKVDSELRSLLAPRIRFGELAGWSGWNIGLSISQSVVRAALLQASRAGRLPGFPGKSKGLPFQQARQAILLGAATAHVELTLQELAHTDLYRNQVLSQVQAYARDNGDDPQYITKVFEGANQLAVQKVRPLADQLFADEFAGTPIRAGNDGRQEVTAVVHRLKSWDMTLAWTRYQELEIFPTLALSTELTDRSTLLTVSVLPLRNTVRPESDVDKKVTAVLRNDVGVPVRAEVSAVVPDGWVAPAPTEVSLAPFEVREVPLTVGVRGLAAEQNATVTVEAAHGLLPIGSRQLTSTATLTFGAVWRNVALASEGATASASGSWRQYVPANVIDGNRVSTGSRWITEAADSHWLRVDFAGPEQIDTVKLYQYGGYELTAYRISGLVDGAWQVLAEVTGNTTQVTTHTVTPVRATAVRLDVLGSRDRQARLYEIEVTCQGTSCG